MSGEAARQWAEAQKGSDEKTETKSQCEVGGAGGSLNAEVNLTPLSARRLTFGQSAGVLFFLFVVMPALRLSLSR